MKNIVENNKLIAEFIGFVADKSFEVRLVDGINTSYYYYKDDVMYLPEVMEYNCSWDWLMEVVDKIESLPDEENNGAFFFKIYQDSVSIIFSNDNYIIDLINVMGQGNRINNVYQAVVEFIQLYNKANKSLS